jgi:hypothetical protein
MVTSFLVCEQKPRQHNTHREKKKEFKLEDEMQRSLRRRGGPQLYPTLTWFAFLLCTLSTGRIGVAAQIADSAVTGCWAMREAQFYATNERRVLHSLAEFKILRSNSSSSQGTGTFFGFFFFFFFFFFFCSPTCNLKLCFGMKLIRAL